MADTSSLTEMSEPQRMAGRVITEKKHSTRLSQEHPGGREVHESLFRTLG